MQNIKNIELEIKEAELKKIKVETEKIRKENKYRLFNQAVRLIVGIITLFIAGWFFITEIIQPIYKKENIMLSLELAKKEHNLVILKDSLESQKDSLNIEKEKLNNHIHTLLLQLKELNDEYQNIIIQFQESGSISKAKILKLQHDLNNLQGKKYDDFLGIGINLLDKCDSLQNELNNCRNRQSFKE